MASNYLKNWRKINSMVNSLAEDDSDEDIFMGNEFCAAAAADDDDDDDDEINPMDLDNDINPPAAEIHNDSEDDRFEEVSEHPDDLCSDLADWAVTNNQTHKSINELLKILRKHGHHELPTDSRTLLSTPRVIERQTKCGGEYIYYGIEKGICRILLQCPASTESIAVCINVDGVPLFKSSGAQFWPMLAKVDGFEPFIVGLFSGSAKPEPLEDYIHDLVEEIMRLKEKGVQHNGRVVHVHIKAFICDAPARAFLKNITYHTGYSSCERCEEGGEWLGKVVYNSKDTFPKRTDEKFSQLAYITKHQNGETPLIRAGIPCVTSFVLDYMHLVCLGVVRLLLLVSDPQPSQAPSSTES